MKFSTVPPFIYSRTEYYPSKQVLRSLQPWLRSNPELLTHKRISALCAFKAYLIRHSKMHISSLLLHILKASQRMYIFNV